MKIHLKTFILINLSFLIFSCSNNVVKQSSEIKTDQQIEINEPLKIKKVERKIEQFRLGIDELVRRNFDILKNKRVGLITNPTGVNSKLKSTIDILYNDSKVNLVALFGPEHGVRGDAKDGEYVEFYTDIKTNLPVFSLYGKTRKPSKKMLDLIDILVYDIQDIGVRSYTFISTMGLAIEAASEAGIEFVVLDRPNPLGGEKIEGNIVEENYISFISQYPIPYLYGLTSGELANLLVGEKMVKTSADFQIQVITMENWNRKMIFEDTGLQWIPTSQHIPHIFSPYFYPMTGVLGELRDAVSIGVGYTLPFQIVGTEWVNGLELANKLNQMKIDGLFFRPITFKPYYAFGKGKTLNGVQIHIVDFTKVNLVKTQFYIIAAIQELYPNKDLFDLADKNQISMFNKGIGTNQISKMISNHNDLNMIFKYNSELFSK